jgi:hypothetical protein
MSPHDPPDPFATLPPLSPEAEELLSRFDGLWQRGQRPALDEFVAGCSPGERLRVLAELVHAEMQLRLRAGEDACAEGWRGKAYYTGRGPDDTCEQTGWIPQGKLIGWVDGDDLYLEPEASYAEAQRLAAEQGESLTVGTQTLRRRLAEKGLLVTRDAKRQKLTMRKTLDGVRRDVLHLHPASLSSPYKTGPTGPRNRPGNGAETGFRAGRAG